MKVHLYAALWTESQPCEVRHPIVAVNKISRDTTQTLRDTDLLHHRLHADSVIVISICDR